MINLLHCFSINYDFLFMKLNLFLVMPNTETTIHFDLSTALLDYFKLLFRYDLIYFYI